MGAPQTAAPPAVLLLWNLNAAAPSVMKDQAQWKERAAAVKTLLPAKASSAVALVIQRKGEPRSSGANSQIASFFEDAGLSLHIDVSLTFEQQGGSLRESAVFPAWLAVVEGSDTSDHSWSGCATLHGGSIAGLPVPSTMDVVSPTDPRRGAASMLGP